MSNKKAEQKAQRDARVIAGMHAELTDEQRAALEADRATELAGAEARAKAAMAADGAREALAEGRPAGQGNVPVPEAGAPAPSLDAAQLAELERERDMLVAAGRAGAFRPISRPADEKPARSADVVVSRLQEAGELAERRDAAFVHLKRESLKPLVAEAKQLLAEFTALKSEIGPALAELSPVRVDWQLWGHAARRHGVFGGVPAVENLRQKIEELTDALSINSSPAGNLARIPRQVAELDLDEIGAGVIREMEQTLKFVRGGPQALRAKWQHIQRQVKALTEALDGKALPLPPLRVVSSEFREWSASEARASMGEGPRELGSRSISDFNPLYNNNDERWETR